MSTFFCQSCRRDRPSSEHSGRKRLCKACAERCENKTHTQAYYRKAQRKYAAGYVPYFAKS